MRTGNYKKKMSNPFIATQDTNESGFVVSDNSFAQSGDIDFSAQQNEQVNFATQTTNSQINPSGTGDEEKPNTSNEEEIKEYKWYHFYKSEFYARWFNVDTMDVLKRMFWGLIPFFGNFFKQTEGNPDLYGPLWIPLTVVFLAFFSGSLSSIIENAYDYKKLSIITGTVLLYIIFIPIILWAVCRFAFKIKNPLVSYICLFGYSYTIYLIVIPLCAIPFWYIQIPLIIIGFLVMSITILKNMFHLLHENTKIIVLIITFIVLIIINLAVAAILVYSVWP
ncbi:protein YIPF1, putative [Entamoeba dispar SAW760]|uniref:Protein YIPF n=1 Tax=Entamoeba dispar (strain ATCC PRA-260 / SAW760) TaxID=370354 RepID=B0EAH4_ENTDS|nr:protein YIPF1, putative [Entamoeba dispar SAW760]EDR28487.1 protein YIPF1, putative [Entamoeba dispar SAW760]|eukprot:EDR28487.1 protein YIPF1, putative [Entamoeba dispar SAW760]